MNGETIPANTAITPMMSILLKGDYWQDGMNFRHRNNKIFNVILQGYENFNWIANNEII